MNRNVRFPAIKVKKEGAEEVRKFLESRGVKDRKRLISVDGDHVIIPIKEEYADRDLLELSKLRMDFEIVSQDKPVFARERNLKDVLKEVIPTHLQKFVPKSYKIIGDIILVKIPSELDDFESQIGKAIIKLHPNCRSVWRDFGKEGELRKPNLRFLAGDKSHTETIKLENGCLFKLDVKKVMYSTGNQHEKMRIAKLIDDEVVVDMFAGIGYFSIPISVHSNARRIYSIEINPDSYFYLLENIKLNKAENIVPILGDSMYITPERVADRVIMGHIFSHEFIEVGMKAIREDGYIHYHESVPLAIRERPIKRLVTTAEKLGKKVEILEYRKVKNYSPGVIHAVVDAYVH